MKRILSILSVSVILGLAAMGAAVEGQWGVEGTDKTAPKKLSIHLNGSSLSGTLDGLAITNSGSAGETFWFHVVRNGVYYTYKGQMKAGKIQLREAGPRTRVLSFKHVQ
jgi:hypothetical protein